MAAILRPIFHAIDFDCMAPIHFEIYGVFTPLPFASILAIASSSKRGLQHQLPSQE
jgi:hypothetical protein